MILDRVGEIWVLNSTTDVNLVTIQKYTERQKEQITSLGRHHWYPMHVWIRIRYVFFFSHLHINDHIQGQAVPSSEEKKWLYVLSSTAKN